MNRRPLISIITPMYNAEKYIRETIDSVLAQAYPHWEMIIVDDGSTDNSYNIVNDYIQKDSRINLYERDRLPKGASTSRNIGIKKSKGDYIIFLDADDILFPTCLENRLETMKKEDNPDFCVFQMNMMSGDKEFDGKHLTHKSENYLYDFITSKFSWTVTCPIWKADFLKEKLTGFDENFIRLEDPELHIRALLLEDVRFKVFSESEYLDCSYRFFKGKINLSEALDSYKQYLYIIYTKIILLKDKQIYFKALRDLYDQIVLFYSTYPIIVLEENIEKMKDINKVFRMKGIIDRKLYIKTNLFLSYIKNKLYRYAIINRLLLRFGFDHFYAFRISNMIKE